MKILPAVLGILLAAIIAILICRIPLTPYVAVNPSTSSAVPPHTTNLLYIGDATNVTLDAVAVMSPERKTNNARITFNFESEKLFMSFRNITKVPAPPGRGYFGDMDWTATNIIATFYNEPIVVKSNGVWIVTFK